MIYLQICKSCYPQLNIADSSHPQLKIEFESITGTTLSDDAKSTRSSLAEKIFIQARNEAANRTQLQQITDLQCQELTLYTDTRGYSQFNVHLSLSLSLSTHTHTLVIIMLLYMYTLLSYNNYTAHGT